MSAEWQFLNGGGTYAFEGWQAEGSPWHDVTKGDTDFWHSPYSLGDVEIAVVHVIGDKGGEIYFTLYGPFSEESIDDIIADALDRYGVE